MLIDRASASSLFRENTVPDGCDILRDRRFAQWYAELHAGFAPRQRVLCAMRASALARARSGELPRHAEPRDRRASDWVGSLPRWCQDQRNLMSVPADDASLVVKALNAAAPVVLLDLEDSVADVWEHVDAGTRTIVAALQGDLPGVVSTASTLFVRPRGLHVRQAGAVAGTATPAPLWDLARIWYALDVAKLPHPLTVSIPKSESAEEACWWRDVFRALAASRGLRHDYVKCMVIDESHPLAYQLDDFLYELRDHVVGVTLGRLDYLASLIEYTFADPAWVLPDRDAIGHDVPFYQRLREHIVEVGHKHGLLAIGGMTALFPDRSDPALNARALRVLEADKRNEAAMLMDGAWTGHPDQNEIALRQFPDPNQGFARRPGTERFPDLRIPPAGAGRRTLDGTRTAVSAVLRYRCSVLGGKGAARIDGYMEDMATERISRLMIAQRMRHAGDVPIYDGDRAVVHDRACIERLFDEELQRALSELPRGTDPLLGARYREARRISQEAVLHAFLDPP